MKEITQSTTDIHSKFFAHELLREAALCEKAAHERWAEAVDLGLPVSNGAGGRLNLAAEQCRDLSKFFDALPSREEIDKFFESWEAEDHVVNDIIYGLKWYWHEAKRLGTKGDEPVADRKGKKAWISIRTKTGQKFYKPMIAWASEMPLPQELYGLGWPDSVFWRELTRFDTSNPYIARLAGTGNLWLKKHEG